MSGAMKELEELEVTREWAQDFMRDNSGFYSDITNAGEDHDIEHSSEYRKIALKLKEENAALKAILAEVEKQTAQVREILRVAANNMAVLHHE